MIIKEEIKNYLTGSGKGCKGKDIALYINERWGMNVGDVEIRKEIQQLRLEGIRIIASPLGYLITNDIELIKRYLKSRGCEVCREMKSFKALAYSCDLIDQLTLWENEYEKECNLNN